MAQQRQPFRFRLPWLAAPQQAPAAPRPSQTTQTQTQQEASAPRPSQGAQPPSQTAPAASRDSRPSQRAQAPAGPQPSQTAAESSQAAPAAPRPSKATQAPSQRAETLAQRAPFRPAGVAPAQPKQSAKVEPPLSQGASQPAPRPLDTQPPKDSAASPLRSTSQIQVSSRTASPSDVSSKALQATNAAKQPPSPRRGGTQAAKTKATTAPPPTPPQPNLTALIKKPLAITYEDSQNSKVNKREASRPLPEEAKPMPKTEAPPEKVLGLLGEPQKPAFEDPKVKASAKFRPQESSPKQELKPQLLHKEAKQIAKDTHGRPKKEANIDKVQGSKAQTIAHPLAAEQGQHSDEKVYDVKEVFQNNEISGLDSERGTRLPQNHAVAGQKASYQKEIKESLPKFVHKHGAPRDIHILHEKPPSIVNLTGDNIGATMHLSSDSQNSKTPIHIHRGYKINRDEDAEKATDGEESSRNRKSGDTKLHKDLATKSYVNNNVQGLNNSLVFNSSVTERNPGVHMVHYRNPIETVTQRKEKENLQTHKAEVTSTPAERLAYAPTIRRRCLRGLLMESSDSDPEKPRRHGCKVGCTQNRKDGIINLL